MEIIPFKKVGEFNFDENYNTDICKILMPNKVVLQLSIKTDLWF